MQPKCLAILDAPRTFIYAFRTLVIAVFCMTDIEALLEEVLVQCGRAPNLRMAELLCATARHLHRLAAETKLTRAEWQGALAFLNRIGQTSTAERDEFMLLSDVLGISTLMDVLHQVPGATDGTVLGPYYAPNAPARENGASVIDTDDGGARLRLRGTVRSLDGWPLAGALVDVWSCASNGLYPAQDPLQAPTNLRGLFRTNGRGQYEFMTLRPTNYSVPTDGPVGKLLQVNARSPMRAAHIHLIVSATGYQTVITHLFDSVSPYLQGDAVFSVRPSLVRNLEKLDENIWAAEFDIALALR